MAADLLVLAGQAITMEPGDDVRGPTAIAIAGDRIVGLGPIAEIRAAHPGVPELGGDGDIALPGLIDAHQHLTGDRLLRSVIPDDLPSARAIAEWAVPSHATHTADDDELSATLALVEAVTNGITFTVEAGTVGHPERVLAAFERVGVGGMLGTWGSDTPGLPHAGPVGVVLERLRAVLDLTAGHPAVTGAVTLVGHDLMSDELAVAAAELARARDALLTFHLSPTPADAAAYLARTQVRPFVHLERLGVLGPNVLAAHAVHLDDLELDVLVDRDVAVAVCPWAYLRLGQGVAGAGRHVELLRRGGRVALGCDSENAGDALDVLRAAALFAGLAKDAARDPAVFGAPEALHLATLGGAAALGRADDIGSLRVGKRADIVVVGTEGPAWTPRPDDPRQLLVWASGGRDVRHVVAGGRVVVRDGECRTVDHRALRAVAQERQTALLAHRSPDPTGCSR